MSNIPTRNQRLIQLKSLLQEGTQLFQMASLRSGFGQSLSPTRTDAETWRAKVISALSSHGSMQTWFTWPEQQAFSALTVDQALNGLQILSWRIVDGRPEVLSDEDADKIGVAT